MRLCVLLRSAKLTATDNNTLDNQNISFLPGIVSTSIHMHGEFLRLLFLQAYRETEAHFTAAGMSSQRNQSDSFRFNRFVPSRFSACAHTLKIDERFVWRLRLLIAATNSGCLGALFHKCLHLSNYLFASKDH